MMASTARRASAVTRRDDGVCRICAAAASPGFAICTSCRDVALALGRPLVPVTPVAFVTGSSPLYRALRQYKSGEPEVAARQQARLAALLDVFIAHHVGCIAPGGLDVCVVVPSTPTGRPPPHPLATLVRRAKSAPTLADALVPVSPLAHRRPSAGAYRASDEVSGKRVLLVDDVYTSGAHLQSAAAALVAAGTRALHAVVLGRFVRSDVPPPRCAHCQR